MKYCLESTQKIWEDSTVLHRGRNESASDNSGPSEIDEVEAISIVDVNGGFYLFWLFLLHNFWLLDSGN